MPVKVHFVVVFFISIDVPKVDKIRPLVNKLNMIVEALDYSDLSCLYFILLTLRRIFLSCFSNCPIFHLKKGQGCSFFKDNCSGQANALFSSCSCLSAFSDTPIKKKTQSQVCVLSAKIVRSKGVIHRSNGIV